VRIGRPGSRVGERLFEVFVCGWIRRQAKVANNTPFAFAFSRVFPRGEGARFVLVLGPLLKRMVLPCICPGV
jgi:hypothetical protein